MIKTHKKTYSPREQYSAPEGGYAYVWNGITPLLEWTGFNENPYNIPSISAYCYGEGTSPSAALAHYINNAAALVPAGVRLKVQDQYGSRYIATSRGGGVVVSGSIVSTLADLEKVGGGAFYLPTPLPVSFYTVRSQKAVSALRKYSLEVTEDTF